MVRRNPAFRMATGGLTVAVMLCLVAAISLLNSTPPALLTDVVEKAAPNDPIQVATMGEVTDLLREHPRKLVPEPTDHLSPVEPVHPPEQFASAQQYLPRQWTPRPAGDDPQYEELPSLPDSNPDSIAANSPSHTARIPIPTTDLESDIAQLKGQINELARSQLESQLAEIRHAEQLLSTHLAQRMIEALQREVDELKRQLHSAVQPSPVNTETGSVPLNDRAALPAAVGESREPIQIPADSESDVSIPPAEAEAHVEPTHVPLVRVRFSESTISPDRYDVDADQASLEELLTKLGPVAGWNLVNGPELKGSVTCRWQGVELQQALVQLLRVHGWQIRQDGDFAIIESITPTRQADANSPEDVDRVSSDSITLQLAPDVAGQVSQANRPETSTPHAQSVPELQATRSLLISDSGHSDNLQFSGGMHRPVAPRRGRIVMKDYPELMALETPPPSPPEQPSQLLEIEATILQFRLAKDAQPGAFRQALTVAGRGPCPLCGVVHSGATGQIGHSAEGWVELGDGVSAGVCLLTPPLITAKLKPLGTISVTSTPHVQMRDRQLAVVGLTELQGFRRHLLQLEKGSREIDFLAGGLQLSLRPTVQEGGLIRLDLQPSMNVQGEFQASLMMSSESCVVIGGLYFQGLTPSASSGQPGDKRADEAQPKDLLEVVVLLSVRPLGNEGSSVPEGQATPPSVLLTPSLPSG